MIIESDRNQGCFNANSVTKLQHHLNNHVKHMINHGFSSAAN